jgi:hypothetical protein
MTDRLDVENRDRRGQDRHERVHRCVLHHRRGGVFRPHHRLKRLDVHEVHENAGQEVQHEVATDGHGPGAENREHQVEGGDEKDALQKAHPDGNDGVAVVLAHLSDRGVIRHAQQIEQERPGTRPSCRFEHLPLVTICAMVCDDPRLPRLFARCGV